MSILKKPYEITVWEDVWDSEKGKFIEQRMGIIGADSMQYQGRAIEPNLTKNANGTKKFTFKMYKHFIDNVTGEKVDNLFSDWLISERKVKLYYNSKWYDFIVKNISEVNDNFLYSYQLEDALVQELSKNGYGVVLNEEMRNNSGNVQTLAKTVLEDTDWTVEAETFVQTIEESLVYLTTTKKITSVVHVKDQDKQNLSNGCNTDESTTIDAGQKVLAFYSSCKNKPHRFQFIYLDTLNDSTLTRDEHRIITNKDCQYFYEVEDPDSYSDPDKKYGFSLPPGFAITTEIEDGARNITVSGKYRGKRIGFTQKNEFIPQLNRYVNIYEGPIYDTKDENGQDIQSTTYYGYQHTEYVSPELTQNVISGSDFSSTSGWIGSKVEHKNLILNSKTESPIESNSYPVASYDLSEDWEINTKYTIAIKGELSNSSDSGYFGIWANGTWDNVAQVYYNELLGLYFCQFTILNPFNENYSKTPKKLYVYNCPDKVSGETTSKNAKIEWIKMEKGWRTFTEWTPAPEDLTAPKMFAIVENVYGYFDGIFKNSIDCISELNTSRKFTPYLKTTFKEKVGDNYSIVLNSGPRDNRLSIKKIDSNEKWILKCKYLDEFGISLNGKLNFSFGEYFYDVNTSSYNLSTDKIRVSSNYWGAIKGYDYFEFTIDSIDYSEAVFKKSSQMFLCINSKEEGENTYYIEDIQLFKAVYKNDKLIEPDTQGKTIEDGVIDSTYYYFTPDKVKDITDSEELLPDFIDKKLVYSTYKPIYNTGAEKIRSVTAKESNYFNILQSIAETFEAWLELDIERDNLGGIISKTVRFKNYLGNENYAGFRYGVNLKSIKRTNESKKLVTKLIVKDNKNEFAKNGFCTISRAGANPTGENYIYDFQYFHNNDLLNARDYIDSVYSLDKANGADLAYIAKIEDYFLVTNTDHGVSTDTPGWVTWPLFSEVPMDAENGCLWYYKKIFYNSGQIQIIGPSLFKTWEDEKGAVQIVTFWYKFSSSSDREDFVSWDDWTMQPSSLPLFENIYLQQYVAINYTKTYEFEIIDPIRLDFNQSEGWNINGYFIRIKNLNNQIENKTNTFLNLSQDLLKTNAKLEVVKTGYDAAVTQIEEERENFRRLTNLENIEKVTKELKERDDVKAVMQKYIIGYQNFTKYDEEKEDLQTKVDDIQLQYDTLQEEIQTLTEYKKILNKLFYQKYSRFIQEGTWISEEYNDDEKYYADALSTMYNSCYPQVAYTFDVLELSQLPGYEGFAFGLGDKTFAEDPEFFGSELREEVVITEIQENLDDPSKNKVKVQNYKNQFQDLFQKITATTQSVQYSTGSYEKAAALAEATQERKQQFFSDALNGMNSVLQNAGNQTVTWGADGITITKKDDASQVLRLVSGAILFKKDDKWVTGITSEGISANLITAGQVDTGRISIMDYKNELFRWDKFGITAFAYNDFEDVTSGLNTKTFVRFDQHGIYGINNGFDGTSWHVTGNGYEGKPLKEIDSLSTFALTWEGLKVTGSTGGTARVGRQSDSIIQVKNASGEVTFKIDEEGNVSLGGNITWAPGSNPADGLDVTIDRDAIYNALETLDKHPDDGIYNDGSGNIAINATAIKAGAVQIGGTSKDDAIFYANYEDPEVKIGGWNIYPQGLCYNGTTDSGVLLTADLYFGATGVYGTGGILSGKTGLIFKAKNDFGITDQGAMYASSGNIGGWNISSFGISNSKEDEGGFTLYGLDYTKEFDGSIIAMSGGGALQDSRTGINIIEIAEHSPYSTNTHVTTVTPNKNEFEYINEIASLTIQEYSEMYSNLDWSQIETELTFSTDLTFKDLEEYLTLQNIGSTQSFIRCDRRYGSAPFWPNQTVDDIFGSWPGLRPNNVRAVLYFEYNTDNTLKSAQILYSNFAFENEDWNQQSIRFYKSSGEALGGGDNYIMKFYEFDRINRRDVAFVFKDNRKHGELYLYDITDDSLMHKIKRFFCRVQTEESTLPKYKTEVFYNSKNTFINLSVEPIEEQDWVSSTMDEESLNIKVGEKKILEWDIQYYNYPQFRPSYFSSNIDTTAKKVDLTWTQENKQSIDISFAYIELPDEVFNQLFSSSTNSLKVSGSVKFKYTPKPYSLQIVAAEQSLPISSNFLFEAKCVDKKIVEIWEKPFNTINKLKKLSYRLQISTTINSIVTSPFILTRNGNLYVQSLKTGDIRVDVSTKRKQNGVQLYLPLQTIVKNGLEFVVYTIYTATDKNGDNLPDGFDTLSGLYIMDKATWDDLPPPVEN